ncbi:unnamed protein product [Porites evermanni]|uniref:Homeobox domain-containing protein n=1 Tax=Porites evermanni TaxID=104178 RepID=A0ABN8MR31_9CNID|nr:unnamed protein product [Porites evermanni]
MAYRIGNDEKDQGQLAPDSKPSVKKYRTRFSPKQKLELENAFYRTPYPSATLRAQLANSLGVTPSVVMNWFKKRRYRWRQKSPNLGMPVPCSCVLPPFQSQTQNRPSQPTYTQGTVFGYHGTVDPHGFQQALVDNQQREIEVGNISQRVIQFNP